MGSKIFLNYRRDDDPGSAGRVFDWVERNFNPGDVFMDVDGIEPGLNFVKVLEASVAQCDVLLAIIGGNWMDCRDESGNRRLDDPGDYVRIEIASALKQHKRVIPVIVNAGRPPKKHQLPDDLKSLAERQATWITHTRFRDDIDKLVPYIRKALDEADKSRLAEAQAPAPTPRAAARRFSRAYLCFAARDRVEVLRRAQAMRLSGIEFSNDLLTLEPGERWESRLYDGIRSSDVFLLFWSRAAAESEFVMREVQVALDAQRSSPEELPQIIPVVLETPAPPPPEMLRHIHFGSSVNFLAAAENAQKKIESSESLPKGSKPEILPVQRDRKWFNWLRR